MPSFAEESAASATSAGQHEHLRRDAPAVQTRPAEDVTLHEGDLPVVQEFGNRIARPTPDDDQVELLGRGIGHAASQPEPPPVCGRHFDAPTVIATATDLPARVCGSHMLSRGRCDCPTDAGTAGSCGWAGLHVTLRGMVERPTGDGFIRCSDGHVRWGVYGAAGVVFVVREGDDPDVRTKPRLMLQKRSAFAHEGGTWSCAGGALDLGETPFEGALREAMEEVGTVPGNTDPARRVRVRPRDRLDVHDRRRGGRGALRGIDELRDRRRRVVHLRRGR